MKKKILIIGSLNVDMVIEMKRMPLTGETVMGKRISYIPGGKGANQACAAARLGGSVKLLGCVGRDDFGAMQIRSLKESGVDTSDILELEGEKTGLASIYVDEVGNNSIVVAPGANFCCDIDYLRKNDRAIRECDYVVLQMEIPFDAICYAIRRASELEKTVILNPAPAPDLLPDDILEKTDYITPNETELRKLAGTSQDGEREYRSGAFALLERGVGHVIVTLGDKGVLLADGDGFIKFAARRVEPVDTTAAGDCFCGAFVTALSEGKSCHEAIRFANAASSISVTRNGAQTSIPNREETEAVYRALGDAGN